MILILKNLHKPEWRPVSTVTQHNSNGLRQGWQAWPAATGGGPQPGLEQKALKHWKRT